MFNRLLKYITKRRLRKKWMYIVHVLSLSTNLNYLIIIVLYKCIILLNFIK
jgi:hypothetical protein